MTFSENRFPLFGIMLWCCQADRGKAKEGFVIAWHCLAGMPETGASVPIPKFAIPCGQLSRELRKQRGTSNLMILVPLLDLKFLNELAAMVQELQIGGTSLFGRRLRPNARAAWFHAVLAGPVGRPS
jgi:hypothetical protein